MKVRGFNRYVSTFVLATSLLAGSAYATSVSDDVTYGMLHGTVGFTNPEITAVSDGIINGNTAVVSPGASLTAEADYALGPVTDVSYCPGCVIQIYAAWIPLAATNGATPRNIGLWSGQTRFVGGPISTRAGSPAGHFSFNTYAPTVHGVYFIGRGQTLDYSFLPTAEGGTGTNTSSGDPDFASFMITVTDDFDFDGVPNSSDACPNTPAETLVDADGCSIAQICPCEGDWKNHGKYVSCVTKAANAFAASGLIQGAEKGAITAAAAQSSCGAK